MNENNTKHQTVLGVNGKDIGVTYFHKFTLTLKEHVVTNDFTSA